MSEVYIENGKVDYKQYGKILDQLEDKIKECYFKGKEIERLKETNTRYFDENRILEKDNIRLNNIIDELEKYCLDEQIPEEYPDFNQYIEIENMIYERIYNKLKELKGSDKE